MRRPLIAVALLYIGGVLIAGLPVPLTALFGVAFGVGILGLIWSKGRLGLLAGLVVLTGWINIAQRSAVLSPYDLRVRFGDNQEIVNIRGTLRESPARHVHHDKEKDRDTYTTLAQIDVGEILIKRGAVTDWQPAYGRITCTTKGLLPDDFFGGQTVEIAGVIQRVPGPVAEGLFDYRSYLQYQGIYHQLRVDRTDDWRILSSPAAPPLADRFSAWARKTLALGLPIEDQPLRLEWALTLGWKAALTEEVSEPFIQAATYHIFAVDGLRIAIVSGIFLALFRVLGVPRPIAGLLVVPIICFYAALTGWPASAIRAIVMAIVVFGGWALNRPTDLINSLFAAAILLLVWEPRQLFQAGFQLSFLVVLCIILIIPLFKRVGEYVLRPNPLVPEKLQPRWRKWLHTPARWLIDLLLVSIAAWLGSIPLAAWYFHILTPGSGPANMFAVPLCGFVLICNLSSLLLGAWLPFAAELFNHAGWLLMRLILDTSQWSADWPGAYYYVPMPSVFTIVLYYLILLTVLTGWLFKGKQRKWKIGGVLVLMLVWCGIWLHGRPVTRLTILPLSGGHAVYLQGPGRTNEWLVDCGSESSVDQVVKPYLRAQGVNRLANFLLTHGEINYTGGAQSIHQVFHPANLYAGAQHFRSPAYNEFQAATRGESVWRKPLSAGDAAGPFSILHPGPDDHFSKGEDNTLVLRAEINRTKILLLSDLGRAGQNALLNRGIDLHADVVVSGLPVEGEPLSDTLLQAIQPRVVIIADAEFPATRKAGDRLRERLARSGIPVIYTRAANAVTIEIRDGDWKLHAMDGTKYQAASGK